MQSGYPLTRELVLIGGGHAHALVLRRWGMRPQPGTRVSLITPEPTAPYTGMLPGHLAGHYPREALDIDMVRLARFAGARLILGHATDLDLRAKRIEVDGGARQVAYDVASIDVGITSALANVPGFAENGIAAKPLGPFADRWAEFLAQTGPARLVVLGAGVAGVELAFAMRHALRTAGRAAEITLVERAEALAAAPPSVKLRLRDDLRAQGIGVLERAEVVAVEPAQVRLSDGRVLPSDLTVSAAGARPHGWLAGIGLDHDGGYLRTRGTLQTSDPDVFAVGDCAHQSSAPRPKAGVYAVRAARPLFRNLRARLARQPLSLHRPQGDFLKLISLGDKRAVAEKFGIAAAGPVLWRWKDRIDRRFMEKFETLPTPPKREAPRDAAAGVADRLAAKPLCAGCGAKVGPGALSEALARLPDPGRADVERAPGDDAGILRIGEVRQVQSTDHLRAFWQDPALFARIAAVHALGDIWAMGAEPQAALVSVTLPEISEAMQTVWLDEILGAAAEVLGGQGAAILGGHTTLGAELTLGFSVSGLCRGTPVTHAGARPGDALILTRPLGSGVLLAAEMACRARGADVVAALGTMVRPQGDAARILGGAHAMTDVTGFGLAGHLMALCRASGVGATIELGALPLYAGAAALAAEGVRSSIFDANRAALPGLTLPGEPLADLLFDPQTAGGLLAAGPEAEAAKALTRLAEAGHTAARIGQILEGPPGLDVQAG